jgi:APA family basic amino acid/polyamine antiporter
MALTFGAYAAPSVARPLAIGVVVALVAVNVLGIEKTALATRAIVAVVLGALALVVVAALLGGEADADRLSPVLGDGGVYGLLQAAGILFFAFAGYARIATLGEEVREPEHTIPRAIPLALGIALLVYAAVAVSALAAVGAGGLQVPAPLLAAVQSGTLGELGPAVRIGAAVASAGVLLSLLAGVSRTTFSMAANRDLPRWLAAVHPKRRVPHHAELAIGAVVIALVAVADLRTAIGFSSFAVLVYYAIANASALTLGRGRPLAAFGLAGCATLALALPLEAVLGGALLLAVGAAAFGISAWSRGR